MRITIGPSTCDPAPTITIDTGHDDDRTSDVVDWCLKGLVLYGYDGANVAEAAAYYGEEHMPVDEVIIPEPAGVTETTDA